MDKDKIAWPIVVSIVFAVMICISAWHTAWSQECRIIRIHGTAIHQTTRVEPEVIVVSKGTCVIWFNRAAGDEVKVIFEEGKQCASVTESAKDFTLDHQNCFVTTWIPFAGTSSLRFMETGTYSYVIESAIPGHPDKKGKSIAEGKIIIRAE
jgi:hypothetical protein